VIEVKEGKVKVERIRKLDFGPYSRVFCIDTDIKRPEIVSWSSSTLTLLPTGFDWESVDVEDFTVIRFPETDLNTSVYFLDRYCVYFIQFEERAGTEVWSQNDLLDKLGA
jgi:hypothetical protein